MRKVAIVGASGFVGGELLRILLGHPNVEIVAATSTQFAGRPVASVHPNLRRLTDLTFCGIDDLGGSDVLFMCTPHDVSMALLPHLAVRASHVIDLSPAFRIRNLERFEQYYGPHTAPELIDDFTCGIPEIHRDKLRTADRIAVPGCTAVASILALRPLAIRGLIEREVDIDARSGSSGSGAKPEISKLHAIRSGAVRVFAFGHRHAAEIAQQTGLDAHITVTAIEAVRGVQVLCRVRLLRDGLNEKDIWSVYREQYANEPFTGVVKQQRGPYRQPEPKVLIGTNFCDIGFALPNPSRRLYVVAAIDNLVKGAAGNAVHCLNIRMGWPERLGLEFPGLHPL